MEFKPNAAADTAKEIESLRAENAQLKASQTSTSKDETLIRQKVAAGLTREQAIVSIRNQAKFDQKRAALTKGAKK